MSIIQISVLPLSLEIVESFFGYSDQQHEDERSDVCKHEAHLEGRNELA